MILLNAQDCGKSQLGTGLPDCVAKEGIPNGFIRTRQGWSVPVASTTFDADFIKENIQNGNFVPFLGAVSFTDNTPEATTEEFDSGVTLVSRQGKPLFSFRWIDGYQRQKINYSYNSFAGGDVLLTFDSGAIAGAVSPDGLSFSGLKVGMQNTNSYKFQSGTESPNTTTTIQLTNPEQFNTRMAVITSASLGFDINSEVFGVIEANVSVVATVPSTIVATVKASANSLYDIYGLVATNFRAKADGVVLDITTVVDNGDSTYTITTDDTFTAADVVEVEIYDETNNSNVSYVGNQPYRGKGQGIASI